MAMTFEINDKEEKLYHEFCEKHKHPETNKGAIGGHISVRFNCTGLGDMASVHCGVCGETESITDYGKF